MHELEDAIFRESSAMESSKNFEIKLNKTEMSYSTIKQKIIATASLIKTYKQSKIECDNMERDVKVQKDKCDAIQNEYQQLLLNHITLDKNYNDVKKNVVQLEEKLEACELKEKGMESYNNQLQDLVASMQVKVDSESKVNSSQQERMSVLQLKCEMFENLYKKDQITFEKKISQLYKYIILFGGKALTSLKLSAAEKRLYWNCRNRAKAHGVSDDHTLHSNREFIGHLDDLDEGGPASCASTDTGHGSSVYNSDEEKYHSAAVTPTRPFCESPKLTFDENFSKQRSISTQIDLNSPITPKKSKPCTDKATSPVRITRKSVGTSPISPIKIIISPIKKQSEQSDVISDKMIDKILIQMNASTDVISPIPWDEIEHRVDKSYESTNNAERAKLKPCVNKISKIKNKSLTRYRQNTEDPSLKMIAMYLSRLTKNVVKKEINKIRRVAPNDRDIKHQSAKEQNETAPSNGNLESRVPINGQVIIMQDLNGNSNQISLPQAPGVLIINSSLSTMNRSTNLPVSVADSKDENKHLIVNQCNRPSDHLESNASLSVLHDDANLYKCKTSQSVISENDISSQLHENKARQVIIDSKDDNSSIVRDKQVATATVSNENESIDKTHINRPSFKNLFGENVNRSSSKIKNTSECLSKKRRKAMCQNKSPPKKQKVDNEVKSLGGKTHFDIDLKSELRSHNPSLSIVVERLSDTLSCNNNVKQNDTIKSKQNSDLSNYMKKENARILLDKLNCQKVTSLRNRVIKRRNIDKILEKKTDSANVIQELLPLTENPKCLRNNDPVVSVQNAFQPSSSNYNITPVIQDTEQHYPQSSSVLVDMNVDNKSTQMEIKATFRDIIHENMGNRNKIRNIKKGTFATHRNVLNILETFLESDLSSENLDLLVKKTENKKQKHLVIAIIDFLCKEREDTPEIILPPMPAMNCFHQRLLCFVNKINCDPPESYKFKMYDLVLKGIEHRLFTLNLSLKFKGILSMTRFYASVCKITKQKEKLKIFCIDAMYWLARRATPAIYVVLQVWPHLFPRSRFIMAQDPLFVVMIHFLLSHFSVNNEYKTGKMHHLLKKRYDFETGKHMDSDILDQLMAMLKGIKPGSPKNKYHAAFLLLGKRCGVEWCQKHIIVNSLLPLLDDPAASSESQAVAAGLLGPLVRPFPATMLIQSEILITKLTNILDKCESPQVEEAAVSSLVSLSSKNFSRVTKELIRWHPSRPLTGNTSTLLASLVPRKNKSFWIKHLENYKKYPINCKTDTDEVVI